MTTCATRQFLSRGSIAWLSYLSVMMMLVAGGCASSGTGNKEVKTVNDECAEARLWLRSRPFQDGPRGTTLTISTPYTSNTWEGWIVNGKSISNLEECLISMMKNEKDELTRSNSAMALGFVGGEASVEPLITALESDIPFIQMEAAASLGYLGKSEAVEPLCSATESSDSNVRANACIALGRIGGARAKTCLEAAVDDKDPFVQNAAKAALQMHK